MPKKKTDEKGKTDLPKRIFDVFCPRNNPLNPYVKTEPFGWELTTACLLVGKDENDWGIIENKRLFALHFLTYEDDGNIDLCGNYDFFPGDAKLLETLAPENMNLFSEKHNNYRSTISYLEGLLDHILKSVNGGRVYKMAEAAFIDGELTFSKIEKNGQRFKVKQPLLFSREYWGKDRGVDIEPYRHHVYRVRPKEFLRWANTSGIYLPAELAKHIQAENNADKTGITTALPIETSKGKKLPFTGVSCKDIEVIVGVNGLRVKRIDQSGKGKQFTLEDLSLTLTKIGKRRGVMFRLLCEIAANEKANSTLFENTANNQTAVSRFNTHFRDKTGVKDNLLSYRGNVLNAEAGSIIAEHKR